MPSGKEAFLERLKAKGAPEADPVLGPPEPDGDEGMSPGQMLLDAIAANDPLAVEEAIKQCAAGKAY